MREAPVEIYTDELDPDVLASLDHIAGDTLIRFDHFDEYAREMAHDSFCEVSELRFQEIDIQGTRYLYWRA